MESIRREDPEEQKGVPGFLEEYVWRGGSLYRKGKKRPDQVAARTLSPRDVGGGKGERKMRSCLRHGIIPDAKLRRSTTEIVEEASKTDTRRLNPILSSLLPAFNEYGLSICGTCKAGIPTDSSLKYQPLPSELAEGFQKRGGIKDVLNETPVATTQSTALRPLLYLLVGESRVTRRCGAHSLTDTGPHLFVGCPMSGA
jgi:hypothetical protein